MNEEQVDRLKIEQDLGKKAEIAMNTFIAPYLARKRKALYDNFCEAEITQVDAILEIKRLNKILDDMEDEIMSVINSGKMSAKMLAEL